MTGVAAVCRLWGVIRDAGGGRTVLDLTVREPSVAGMRGALLLTGMLADDGKALSVDIVSEAPLVALGTSTIAQKATVALAAGIRRITVATPPAWKIDAGQALIAAPLASLPGYTVHDVVVTKPDEISVGITCPALALNASFALPVKLIRFT